MAKKNTVKKADGGDSKAQRATKHSAALEGRLEKGGSAEGIRLIPALLFSSVVLLIVRGHHYSRPMTQFFWTEKTDDTQLLDFFSYNKMRLIVVCAALALLFMLVRAMERSSIRPDRRNKALLICMGGYSLFVLLSYMLSGYKEFSLWGWNDRFEGTVTLLCYMVMLIYMIGHIASERGVRIMLGGITAAIFAEDLLGFFQSIDIDFFRSTAGQKLISPNETLANGSTVWQQIDSLAQQGQLYYKFNFTNRQVYQTVYNINYVSFYLCLVIPVFVMLFIRSWMLASAGEGDGKGLRSHKAGAALMLVMYAFTLYNFFCANSASGYFGLVTMFLLAVFFCRKKLKAWAKPLAVIALVTVLVMVSISDRWWPEIKKKIIDRGGSEQELPIDESELLKVSNVITGDDWFSMDISGKTLRVEVSGDQIYVDGDGQPIDVEPSGENGIYLFEDEHFSKWCRLYIIEASDKEIGLGIETVPNKEIQQRPNKDNVWVFRFTEDGVSYRTPVGKYTALSGSAERFGFEGRERLGSGRGAIWANSLPMLKNSIFIGPGADTYCINYPQYDYGYKYTLQNNILIVVDKPHCIYLDIALNTGLVSLVFWLGIIALFVKESLRGCCRVAEHDDLAHFAGFGAFLGCCAFLVVGLFNDSTVSTMPLFYSMLAIGFACNRLIAARETD
ncbi:MAG: O-antigen ligase family protein [Firmicutes bacterium]|nr:O-antigen ligase family protein [Bacillota bacterium]